tara:strand:- start:358 stop:603 length:246 start_codon:yes stop_codon:yes gene_type:complete
MAKNRELSQVGNFITVKDSSGQIGIANSVGINTTSPTGSFALDVHGTTNLQGDTSITGTLNINGESSATQGDATALAIALG